MPTPRRKTALLVTYGGWKEFFTASIVPLIKFIWRLQTKAKKIEQQAQSKYTTPIITQDLETNIRDAIVSC
jgi:hypothetical protein